MRPNPNPLPSIRLEIFKLRQWPINARGGYFQRITAVHWIVNVEEVAKDWAQAL
jgi:hypothetical protein